MKEIALLGTTCQVFADVLSSLLEKDMTVCAMVDTPSKVMLDNSRLTVQHLPVEDHDRVKEDLEGYHDAVLTYNDDLTDAYTNSRTLNYFVDTLTAARQAGVARLIVVGSPVSEAFFVTELKRIDDIDWVFISTEGDFPHRVAREIIEPRFHKEVYVEE